MHDALACWEFCHVMKPGDTIFVKKGAKLVLGHGVVRSEYRFDEARPEYKHVRDVEWLSKTDGVKIREKELVRKTLTDITKLPDQVADAKRAFNIEEHSELLDRIKRCRRIRTFEANEVDVQAGSGRSGQHGAGTLPVRHSRLGRPVAPRLHQ